MIKSYIVLLAILVLNFSRCIGQLSDLKVQTFPLYHIDSIIKTNDKDYVGVYLWATWCQPCVAKLPQLINYIKRKNNLYLFLVATPDSKDNKIVRYIASLNANEHIIKFKGHNLNKLSLRKIETINDISDIRYFNDYFTPDNLNYPNERFGAFYLFEKGGKLIYTNSGAINMDSVLINIGRYTH